MSSNSNNARKYFEPERSQSSKDLAKAEARARKMNMSYGKAEAEKYPVKIERKF